MGYKTGIKRFFILLGLPTIIWLYHNQVVNWHFHVMENGTIVRHAHPYDANTVPGTPFQEHGHNHLEYAFLSLLYNTVPLLALLLALGVITRKAFKNTPLPLLTSTVPGFGRWPFLRGPPPVNLMR